MDTGINEKAKTHRCRNLKMIVKAQNVETYAYKYSNYLGI